MFSNSRGSQRDIKHYKDVKISVHKVFHPIRVINMIRISDRLFLIRFSHKLQWRGININV